MSADTPSYADTQASRVGDRPPVKGRLAYFSAQAVVEGQDSWAAVTEVVHGFEAAGWEVELFCPAYGATQDPGVLRRLSAIAGAQRRVLRRLREFDALYVRVHPLAWPAAWLAARRIPTVQESNGSWHDALAAWPSMRWAAPLMIAIQKAQYRAAAGVIAVSDGLARWLEDATGRRDVVVSPNGANDSLFRPGAPRREGLPARYVVFVGQFAPWQRVEVLLEAARDASWPDGVDVVLVGDGAARPAVEAAARSNARVHFLGPLPYHEVAGVLCGALASAVLTYAPERAGYSPLKLYESMACGVPIVCSDTPGQAEFVRAEDAGVVVPPGDPGAVARAVSAIAADRDAARAMGARGRRAVEERYSWAARARQRLDVVESAIERWRGGKGGGGSDSEG